MIKTWKSYNESNLELSHEMIVDIIYFRNCTVLDDEDAKIIAQKVDRLINVYLRGKVSFSSDETCITNKEEYTQTQSYIKEIYNIALRDKKIKDEIISIYSEIKPYLGKVGFSTYEDIFIDFIDDGYMVDFCLRLEDKLEIDIKKEVSFDEYIKMVSMVKDKVNRISKLLGIGSNAVYIEMSEYYKESESIVKIFIL